MKLALHLSNFTPFGAAEQFPSRLSALAQIADEGGVDTITVMDHWFQMENLGGPFEPMLEGYSTLSFLAAHTERVRLGTLVTGVTYRWPGLLAKTVATLDVLSGGRAFLGIGAAWYEREHHGLGVPYPPTAERFERLEEALQICQQMFSDDDGPYEGRHYQLAETICLPRPVQSPRPPIMIGGTGEQKTLRFVARYADACNLFALPTDQVAHKLEVLDEHCRTEGRDPAEIRRTVITGNDPLDDLDGFLSQMVAYDKLGIDTVWVNPGGPDPVVWTEKVVSEVGPRLRDL